MANGSQVSKTAFWTGWILSILPCIMFIGGGAYGLTAPPEMAENAEKMGWPPKTMTILAGVEIACAIIYLIPQTAILGAILLTGYLGGAVATHVRINDPLWVVPVLVGVIVWLGLFLRDARLRQLIPFRR